MTHLRLLETFLEVGFLDIKNVGVINCFIKTGPACSRVAVGMVVVGDLSLSPGDCMKNRPLPSGTEVELGANLLKFGTEYFSVSECLAPGSGLGLLLLLASCCAGHYWECSEQLRLVPSLLSSCWQVAWLFPCFRRNKRESPILCLLLQPELPQFPYVEGVSWTRL